MAFGVDMALSPRCLRREIDPDWRHGQARRPDACDRGRVASAV